MKHCNINFIHLASIDQLGLYDDTLSHTWIAYNRHLGGYFGQIGWFDIASLQGSTFHGKRWWTVNLPATLMRRLVRAISKGRPLSRSWWRRFRRLG